MQNSTWFFPEIFRLLSPILISQKLSEQKFEFKSDCFEFFLINFYVIDVVSMIASPGRNEMLSATSFKYI